jgi:multicomponent Na+:H+ antiporter subunit D
VFVADVFSGVMIAMTGTMGFAVAVYAWADLDRFRIRSGFYPLYHVLLMGVSGAFLTGDLFNLYVWFEVMLMASFVLMVLGGDRGQLEGAVKYVVMNLLASILFLSAVGILYGKVGTLNMADLAVKLTVYPHARLVTAVALLLLTAFATKAALFPLFFWLPASYHTPPSSVSAIFSALLTKVGIYSIVRVFTLVFHHDEPLIRTVLLWIATLTMVTGVLGAMAQYDFRRLLSFHIVSQMGYLALGLGLALGAVATDTARLALASVVFFTVHVATAKAGLFLVSGVTYHLRGTYDLKRLGGLSTEKPFLAVLFLIAALALAGIPPLSGFVAKFAVVRAGLEAGMYLPVAVALAVSLLTLFSMIKIWDQAFWKPAPDGEPITMPLPNTYASVAFHAPIVLLAAVCIGMGVAAGPLMAVSLRAATQMLDAAVYINAVFEVAQ